MPSRELAIIMGSQNFLKGKYPISYRLVICHALNNLLNKNGYDLTAGKKSVEDIFQYVQDFNNKDRGIRIPSFLEIYPIITAANKKGFTVIDRSSGCFPLVMYPPDDTESDHGDRISAFYNACEDVHEKIDTVIEKLTEYQGRPWMSFQNQILLIFPYE